MREHVFAQVRDDALAQPRDEKIAQGRGQGHDKDKGAERGKGRIQSPRIGAAETLVDQPPHHESHGRHGGRRDRQENQHEGKIDLLPRHIGHEAGQRLQVPALFAAAGGLLDRAGQFGPGGRTVLGRSVGLRLRHRIGHMIPENTCVKLGDHVRAATSYGKRRFRNPFPSFFSRRHHAGRRGRTRR